MTTAELHKLMESIEFVRRYSHFLTEAERFTFNSLKARRLENLAPSEISYIDKIVKRLTEELA